MDSRSAWRRLCPSRHLSVGGQRRAGAVRAALAFAAALSLLLVGCGSGDEDLAGQWTAVEGYGGLIIERSDDEYTVTLVDGGGHESTPQTTTLRDGQLRFDLRAGELPLPQGPDLIAVAAKIVVSGDPASGRIELSITTSSGTGAVELMRAEKIRLQDD